MFDDFSLEEDGDKVLEGEEVIFGVIEVDGILATGNGYGDRGGYGTGAGDYTLSEPSDSYGSGIACLCPAVARSMVATGTDKLKRSMSSD